MDLDYLGLLRNDDHVCPYCGFIQCDALGIDFGEDAEGSRVIDCDVCGKEFRVTRNIEVSYTTSKEL